MMWAHRMRSVPTIRYLALLFSATCGQGIAASINGVVTDGDGSPVAEAVLYAVPAGRSAGPAPRPATMDQVDKEFLPLVVPVQLGSAVRFPNKDNIRHHVYSFSPAKTFELKLYAGTPSNPVIFDKPGPVVLGCNIHDWMVGFVYVVDTPYFTKTNSAGKARLDGLPAGDYSLQIWHPHARAATPARPLSLAADATEATAYRLDLSKPKTATGNR